MNFNIDVSHLSNTDMVTLAWILGIILIVFVILLITQRKYLASMRRKPQYKVDAEHYEELATEARQNNADAREALKQADYLMALSREGNSWQDRAAGEDAEDARDEADAEVDADSAPHPDGPESER